MNTVLLISNDSFPRPLNLLNLSGEEDLEIGNLVGTHMVLLV